MKILQKQDIKFQKFIKQIATDEVYDEAIDVENALYTYTETDIPVEAELIEPQPETDLTVKDTLETPVTYQLTPTEVATLLGDNTIWADTGDTTAEYRADTKLYIERLTAPDSADMIGANPISCITASFIKIKKRANNILITINKTIAKHTTTTTFHPSKNKLPKTQKNSEFINSLKRPRKKHYVQSFG